MWLVIDDAGVIVRSALRFALVELARLIAQRFIAGDNRGIRGGRRDNSGGAGGHELSVNRAYLLSLILRDKLLWCTDKGAVFALVEVFF